MICPYEVSFVDFTFPCDLTETDLRILTEYIGDSLQVACQADALRRTDCTLRQLLLHLLSGIRSLHDHTWVRGSIRPDHILLFQKDERRAEFPIMCGISDLES
jgi:hypothetical protein